MKVIGNKIEYLQGERHPLIMSGFDFDLTSQIVVLLYKSTESGVARAFVKRACAEYPEAGLITKLDEDDKMVFTIDTTGMPTGNYDIEARVDIAGVVAPILKERTEFLTVKQSRT